MPINFTTVYTEQRLLRYNTFFNLSKVWYWITLSVCTVLDGGMAFLALLGGFIDTFIIVSLCLVLFIDVFSVLWSFVFPIIFIKKSKTIGTELRYSFDEDAFSTTAVNEHMEESGVFKYSTINKVRKNRDDVYLFTAPRSAYIVDLENSSYEEQAAFKQLLQSKIAAKNFKW